MSEKMVRVGGLEFCAEGGEEPRALDVAIGETVGLSRPRDVRRAIRSALKSGLLQEKDCRALGARRKIGAVSGEVTEYWLTEMGARLLATQLNSPRAIAMTREMVEWFVEARRQLSSEPALPAPVVERVIDSGPRMGDSPEGRAEVFKRCLIAARACGLKVPSVLGFVRRMARTSSPYFVTDMYWRGSLLRMLDDVAMGRIVLAKGKRVVGLLGADSRQIKLFGSN